MSSIPQGGGIGPAQNITAHTDTEDELDELFDDNYKPTDVVALWTPPSQSRVSGKYSSDYVNAKDLEKSQGGFVRDWEKNDRHAANVALKGKKTISLAFSKRTEKEKAERKEDKEITLLEKMKREDEQSKWRLTTSGQLVDRRGNIRKKAEEE